MKKFMPFALLLSVSMLTSCGNSKSDPEIKQYEIDDYASAHNGNTVTETAPSYETVIPQTTTQFQNISHDGAELSDDSEPDEVREYTSGGYTHYTPPENDTPSDDIPDSHYIDVDMIYQEPELPTGCEVTSLAMLLNYWGHDVGKVELSEEYMQKNYDYTCTFKDAFIGTPTNDSGFGCYSPVIVDTAHAYLSEHDSSLDVYNLSGMDLRDIFSYIADDKPVVIWSSMYLVDVRYYLAWVTESGEEAWWYENEHCMLLTGYDYDDGTVTVCDPLRGEWTYSMARFEEIYDELEQQAVTIY